MWAFFDREYEVEIEYNENPLYVFIEKDFFAVLVHKSQEYLKEKLNHHGCIIKDIDDKNSLFEEIT